MCKIHHAAFDNLLMGVRPDYSIEVRSDVLVEEDGPTLRYALQGLTALASTFPANAPPARLTTSSRNATSSSAWPGEAHRSAIAV
jgi:hypothetical protein